jgi:hypothetical protein
VQVSRLAPKRGRPKLWGYSYPDLAALFGMTEGAVRQAVFDGRLDPASLDAVVSFAVKRRARQRAG